MSPGDLVAQKRKLKVPAPPRISHFAPGGTASEREGEGRRPGRRGGPFGSEDLWLLLGVPLLYEGEPCTDFLIPAGNKITTAGGCQQPLNHSHAPCSLLSVPL